MRGEGTIRIVSAFVLPLLCFLLMVGTPTCSAPSASIEPRAVAPSAMECAAEVRAPDSPPYWDGGEPGIAVEHHCDPIGCDWWFPVNVQPAVGSNASCPFEIFILEKPRNDKAPAMHMRERAYADSTKSANNRLVCERGETGLECVFRGAPWKRYDVIPFVGDEIVGAPLRLTFYQTAGPNIRCLEGARFAGSMVIAVLLLGVGFLWRPGGRRFPASGLPRWLKVGLTGGFGGVVMSGVYVTRPPDVGGYDNPQHLIQWMSLCLILFALGALLGITIDWLRPSILRGGKAFRWISIAVFCVLVPIICISLFASNSPYAVHLNHYHDLNYKSCYYAYFGLAVSLPILLYWDRSWAQRQVNAAGILKPTHERWLETLAWSVLGGLIATIIAIFLGPFYEGPLVHTPLAGFSKPSSGFGLCLMTFPICASVSLAVHLGTEKPRWVQALDASLSGWVNGTFAKRNPSARAAVRCLIENESRLARASAHLLSASLHIPELIAQLEANDIKMIARDFAFSESEIIEALPRIKARFEKLQPERFQVETPLLLVDSVNREVIFTAGQIAVGRIHETRSAGAASYLFNIDGRRVLPGGQALALQEGVQNILKLVFEDLGIEGPRWATERTLLWEIGFHYMGQGSLSFRGRSYQLSLMLALCQAETRRAPLHAAWAATGALDCQHYNVTHVEHIGAKSKIITQEGCRLLITNRECAEELQAADPIAKTEIYLLDMHSAAGAVEVVRTKVAAQLRDGGRAVVGVCTVHQAIHILLGER